MTTGHPLQIITPEVSDVFKSACEILKPLGITYFMFYTNFTDGRELKYSNKPEITEKFVKEGWYKKSVFTRSPEEYSPGFLWYEITENSEIVKWTRAFNIGNVLSWINPTDQGCEVAHFGSEPNNTQILNFYLNHLDLLKRFLSYFKNSLAETMDEKSMSYLLPNRISDHSYGAPQQHISNKTIQQFSANTHIKKYQLPAQYHNEHLTPKECEVLRWLTTGLSVPGIANEVHKSKRTIESHIANLKSKLNIKTKNELVLFAQKFHVE